MRVALALGALSASFLPTAVDGLKTPTSRYEHQQVPLAAPVVGSTENTSTTSEWSFTQRPQANATGHLIFDTVNSLLQHWPNTRYRNGHTLVPGIVPPGTLLYHGTASLKLPSIPEWTATDPEHSYLFCRSISRSPTPDNGGCYHLTLSTTRALNVIYFDGSSAAKMLGGPMDSQDLLLWGRVWEEKTFRERERLDGLCEWARGRGVDGFVRMEMDFEIMLCDFTAGVEVVSFLNLETVDDRPRPPRPDDTPTPPSSVRPSAPSVHPYHRPYHAPITASGGDGAANGPWLEVSGPDMRVLESGSWHNTLPGETRVILDYTRLISFYDLDLFPSLSLSRANLADEVGQKKKRLGYRLEGISEADAEGLKERMEVEFFFGDNDKMKSESGSGVDWKNLYKTIAERYSGRLEMLGHILDSQDVDVAQRLGRAQRHLGGMLAPYILHTAHPPPTMNTTSTPENDEDEKEKYAWAQGVFEHCALTHTRYLARPDSLITQRLTRAERTLLGAAQDVSKEICRVLVSLWAQGKELGVNEREEQPGEVGRRAGGDEGVLEEWRKEVEALMGWLDWSGYWLKCRPACGFEELCLLPTWPFFSRPRGPRPKTEPEGPNDWEDPQPKCIRIAEPYSSL